MSPFENISTKLLKSLPAMNYLTYLFLFSAAFAGTNETGFTAKFTAAYAAYTMILRKSLQYSQICENINSCFHGWFLISQHPIELWCWDWRNENVAYYNFLFLLPCAWLDLVSQGQTVSKKNDNNNYAKILNKEDENQLYL